MAIEGRGARRSRPEERRQIVDRIASAQLLKLESMMAKGHWDREQIAWLLERAEQELIELREVLSSLDREARAVEPDRSALAKLWVACILEAADVCNFIAMAIDNAHAVVDWRDSE